MVVSTKGRYALRMIVDLAGHMGDNYVTLKDVAERQGISKKYLEQIVAALNKGDILQANRGFSGGYKLKKSPDKLTVGEILRQTEGNLAPTACTAGGTCERSAECATIFVWQGLDKVINEYLDNITVQDILDRQSCGGDYCI
ncbi:MAG: RrF2 family transcriptional regulator [Candidatus Coproplasma sp.]